MPRSMKLWAGLYGLAFHAIVVATLILIEIKNRANIPPRFWWVTVPPYLVAAFVVYVLLVGRYLPRRPTTKGAVFFDSAVGMLAELAIVVLTALLYSVFAAGPAFAAGGVGGYLSDAASTAIFAFLWTLGSFFTQILIVGNAAGLVGWVVLNKLAPRRPPAVPPPASPSR